MKNQKLLDFLTMLETDKAFSAGVWAAAQGGDSVPEQNLPEDWAKARWGFDMAKGLRFVEVYNGL